MNKFKIKIVLQSNDVVVEKDIVKFEWITETRLDVYDKNENKTRYFLGTSFVIIEEIEKD